MAEDNGSSSIGWFLAGLGLGALMGVLFAPKAGNETRELLAKHAGTSKDYVKNSGQQARESFNEWMDRGKDFMDKQKRQVSTAVESAKQAYREKTETPGV